MNTIKFNTIVADTSTDDSRHINELRSNINLYGDEEGNVYHSTFQIGVKNIWEGEESRFCTMGLDVNEAKTLRDNLDAYIQLIETVKS